MIIKIPLKLLLYSKTILTNSQIEVKINRGMLCHNIFTTNYSS